MGALSFVKEEKYAFPKKVGIIFLERRKRKVKDIPPSLYEDILLWKKQKDELKLDFDQDACAFLLLHLNHYQNIFEFQVVDIAGCIPKKNKKECLFDWLDKFASVNSDLSINYWMGITSERVQRITKDGRKVFRHFYRRKADETKSGKILWIITSLNWEEYRSPPSLFEYLLASVFRCAIESLSRELEDSQLKKERFLRHVLHSEVTRGCMFDFTHRRSSVSFFKLCFNCREKLRLLEELIRHKGKNWDINLVDDVNTILSKEWMGTPEKRDSPLFNLKKIYKYDVDRNSGFNKGYLEKFRDSIYDKSAEWIVSGIIGAIITGAIAIVFRLIG